ncbi:hypothetical protein DSO57_1011186 [Entomophthora muscae]|uniref:Uncharacterized protein n=1 Tax=Entomophthora muscae TaxID=34485 RepID=A0ACC2UFP3_9FUNG|nr:hypothetical protein DSO57_1011186 [Entomophthora muscae]
MGSSSGSAVAANLALVSLGTETLGSVISPASCNMVVGFKPTYNWTSTKGIIPLIPSLDTVGVLTRTVQDSHLVMEVLHDNKPKCSALDLPKKIGIISPVNDPPLQEKFNAAIAHLKTKIQVQENLNFSPEFVDMEAVMALMTNEFKHHINQYLSQGTNPLSLKDIINYNIKHNHTTNSSPQEILEDADGRDGDLDDELHLANKARITTELRIKIEQFMDKNNLDAIMIPSVSSQNDLIIPDLAGFPIITIPAGLVNSSVPQGLSLYTKQNNECIILSLASTLEHISALKRSPPKFYFASSSASQAPPRATILASILLLFTANLR